MKNINNIILTLYTQLMIIHHLLAVASYFILYDEKIK